MAKMGPGLRPEVDLGFLLTEKNLADRPFDAESYVDIAAALIGLPLDPAHRPGVILNVQRIAEMAELVMAFPLPEETEPAPVFRP
jgi:Protein of unknown function (DUF4089)